MYVYMIYLFVSPIILYIFVSPIILYTYYMYCVYGPKDSKIIYLICHYDYPLEDSAFPIISMAYHIYVSSI